MTREIKIPGPDHPITIEPTQARVVVGVDGVIIADSTTALTLQESTYPAVQYIPLADVKPELLRRTDTSTYCPFKGDASYYSLALPDGTELTDVIWTYEQPFDAVAPIAGHVAFYTDKVEMVVIDEVAVK
jgi:uncharacterized protein (DUF427 family)